MDPVFLQGLKDAKTLLDQEIFSQEVLSQCIHIIHFGVQISSISGCGVS